MVPNGRILLPALMAAAASVKGSNSVQNTDW